MDKQNGKKEVERDFLNKSKLKKRWGGGCGGLQTWNTHTVFTLISQRINETNKETLGPKTNQAD